jgi:hypothetical protein
MNDALVAFFNVGLVDTINDDMLASSAVLSPEPQLE